jgi:hypothetical protein
MAMQAAGSYASIQEEIVATTMRSAVGETPERVRLRVTGQVEQVPAPARMRVVGGRSREANVPRVASGAGLVSPGAVRWALETVKQLVSEFYGIPVAELVGQERTADLVYPRQMGMAVCRDVTLAGLVQMGACLPGSTPLSCTR